MAAVKFYLITINIISFVIMGTDKALAKRNSRRIPERVLFAVSLLGGSAGTLAGMYFFHHKTKHVSFVIGIPAILLLQTIILFKLLASS